MQANYSRTLHKSDLIPLKTLWVIRQRLHMDKIYKNKIHSYNISAT